jgi:hypothetical protein
MKAKARMKLKGPHRTVSVKHLPMRRREKSIGSSPVRLCSTFLCRSRFRSVGKEFADVRLLIKVSGNVAKLTSLDAYRALRAQNKGLQPWSTMTRALATTARAAMNPDQVAPDGEPAVICETQGAMSQQSSDAAHGHESVPQKLLQLVGYRDPNACSTSWQRLRRNGTN